MAKITFRKRKDGVCVMLANNIEKLRNELYYLINANYNYDDIYKMSVELDKLIVEFYRENH